MIDTPAIDFLLTTRVSAFDRGRVERGLQLGSLMRLAQPTRVLLGCLSALVCSLSSTHVLRAEDTPVYETPQPTQTSSAAQQRDPESAPVASEKSSPPRGDYTTLLIGGYIAAPLLGVGLALGLSQLDHGQSPGAWALVGVFGAWLVPAMVHWFNDQTELGFRALFMPPLLALSATLVVSLISFGVLSLAKVPPPDPEDGSLNRGITAVEIGFVAAGFAVIAWAVYDILDSAPSSKRSRATSRAAFRVAVVPTEHGAAGMLSCSF